MLVILLFLGDYFGRFNLIKWDMESGGFFLLCVLAVLFLSKVPVFPFHSWLPVVHAEASRAVSVCLRGYIMKLGILGLMRFCYYVLSEGLLKDIFICFFLLFSMICFLWGSFENDKKRWLAYLRLAHIVMGLVCLKVGDLGSWGFRMSYCLGHALSAGLGFMVFWLLSGLTGGRRWFVVKKGLVRRYGLVICVVLVMCFCGSLPVCLQFFCELWLVSKMVLGGVGLLVCFCFYLFLGGIVPVVCLCHLLTRFRDVSPLTGRW